MPLTQDKPCILLHVVEPGSKLMDVASSTAMLGRTMHHRNIAEDLMKVKLAIVVPEYRDILPPINLRAQRMMMLWSLGIASVGL
jgi:hypothetical protein